MSEIMVVAGEASGDMHAAEVVKKIKELAPEVSFFGLGGDSLLSEGVDIIYDPTEKSTIGFIEAAKNLRLMYKILNELEAEMKRRQPEAVFLVDYSGFNMKVAKRTAKLEVPTVDYFAPSAWVWGKWRAKKMAERNVKIASVFPMEEKVYREAGAEVEFVGHPLVDMVEPDLSTDQFVEKFDLSLTDRPVIGLLPGSRKQELDSLLDPMLEAAVRIKAEYPDSKFLLPAAKTISERELQEKISTYNIDINIFSGYSYEVMEAADLLLASSGTATLEAACLKTPMVIAYKTSWSTYLLGKLLVNLPHVGLPNIIAGEEIVPELLQREVTGEKLAKEALEILNSRQKQQKIKKRLNQVKEKLGAGGAIRQVAELVLAAGGINHGTS